MMCIDNRAAIRVDATPKTKPLLAGQNAPFDIIINKYKKSLPNLIYDIELEKLTEFPESESKSLLKFCELDWSPESLQFYNRTNIISKTSSQTQIRNPIYKKNVNDFLNYQEFLIPFGKKYYWFN